MLETALFLGGILLGIYGVVLGGAMFLAAPLFQLMFPEASLGQIIGNIKIGSIARGLTSSWTTWPHIKPYSALILAIPFAAGAACGAWLISDLNQYWMIAAMVGAIIACEATPRLQLYANSGPYYLLAFLAGLYGGVFGAGLALLIVALLRLHHPENESIAAVKIQARFIELLITASAILAHFWVGNLVARLFLPWSLGSLIGGFVGGIILARFTATAPTVQRTVLRISYTVGILGVCLALWARAA